MADVCFDDLNVGISQAAVFELGRHWHGTAMKITTVDEFQCFLHRMSAFYQWYRATWDCARQKYH